MLPREFYLMDTIDIAMELVGCTLVRTLDDHLLSGRIVETEAYLPENDTASHSYKGKSKRNTSMFEKGGILYVYLIYGVHHCINVVTENEGKGTAVLIRAIEPIFGIEIMQKNRGESSIFKLCRGPGNLAKAFKFDLKDNFSSLTSNSLYILPKEENVEIETSERVGITKSADLKLRFFEKHSKFVSGK